MEYIQNYLLSSFPVSCQYEDSDEQHVVRISKNVDKLGVNSKIECTDDQILYFNSGNMINQLMPSCFINCNSLHDVVLQKNIKIINNEAFRNCENLSSFSGTTDFYVPKIIGGYAFENCNFEKLNLLLNEENNNNTYGYDIYGVYGDDEEDEEEDKDDEEQYEEIYDLPQNQIQIDYGVFSGNRRLTDVSMDYLVLGPTMFNNCTKLSSVVIADEHTPLISGPASFRNCTSLSQLTFPKQFKSYWDLHGSMLQGSSVSAMYMHGMTSAEAEFAVGGSTKTQVVMPSDYDDIKLGSIYKFSGGGDSDVLNQLIEKAINGHVPIIFVECNNACPLCITFEENVLNNGQFVEFFSKQKCIMIYLKGIYRLTAGGDVVDWSSVKYPTIRKTQEFTYINHLGEAQKSTFLGEYVIYGRFDVVNLDIKAGVDKEFDIQLPRWRIKKIGGKMHIYRCKWKSASWRHLPDEEKTIDSYLDDSQWDEYTDKFNSPLVTIPMESASSKYPVVGYYWRQNTDITVSSKNFLKLDDEVLKKFLNGESFSLNMEVFRRTGRDVEEKANVEFIFTFCWKQDCSQLTTKPKQTSRDGIYLLVDKTIIQYRINTRPSIRMLGRIYVDNNTVYIQCTYGFPMDRSKLKTESVHDFNNTIKYLCDEVMKCGEVNFPQTEQEPVVNHFYGNCWGVEHDCVVYDETGEPHFFYYKPPT